MTYLKAKKKINAKNYCYSIYEDRTLEWYYKNDENELIKNI
ncbi:MAG: hypothetical protein P1U46_04820 [Patescibacteria group bacterium]|nr:hypothetical protein [Patescibacteria group bacterium]